MTEFLFYGKDMAALRSMGGFVASHWEALVWCLLAMLVWFIVRPELNSGGRRSGTYGFGAELGRDGLMLMFGNGLWRIEHRWSLELFRRGLRCMVIRASNGPPPNHIWFIDILGLSLGYAPNGQWRRVDRPRKVFYFGQAEEMELVLTMFENPLNPFRMMVRALVSISSEPWLKDGNEVSVRTISLAMVGERPFICRTRKYNLPLNVIALDWVLKDDAVPADPKDWADEMIQPLLDTRGISVRIDPMVSRRDGAVVYDGVGYRVLGIARPNKEGDKT